MSKILPALCIITIEPTADEKLINDNYAITLNKEDFQKLLDGKVPDNMQYVAMQIFADLNS